MEVIGSVVVLIRGGLIVRVLFWRVEHVLSVLEIRTLLAMHHVRIASIVVLVWMLRLLVMDKTGVTWI